MADDIDIGALREEASACCRTLRAVIEAGAVDYGPTVSEELSRLERAVAEYEFRIYLVGPFSCGKSTLLNNWMGVDLLPKGISPETAVATELHFSETERTVLFPFDENGSVGEPIELAGVGAEQMARVTERANEGGLARVRLYVNNPRLRDCADVCLVDLPGLSSTCRSHELALHQFVLEKSVGIFCVPMPAGTIQQDALEFLQEMERYRASFNLLLTKADECSASDGEEIRSHVARTVQDRLGIPDDEFHVSVVSRNDVSGFDEQLDGLRSLRAQIFCERFHPALRAICDELLLPLNFALAKDYSSDKAASAVAALQDAESRLAGIFEDVSSQVSEVVPGAVDRVVGKVKDTLAEKADGWLSCLKTGGNCSEDVAATIKRTILHCVDEEAHDICDNAARIASREFGKCVSFSVGEIGGIAVGEITGKVSDGGEIFSDAVKGFAAGAAGYAVAMGTVGAALGSAVPILGTGIGFVVGSLLGGLVGAFSRSSDRLAENERVRGRLLEQLEAEGEKTRGVVARLLNDVVDGFVANLKELMEAKASGLRTQMESLRAAENASREELEAKKARWNEAARTVRSIADALEESAACPAVRADETKKEGEAK